MAMRDLIPWSRGRELTAPRSEGLSPFINLHREMNRLFDDVFRGFDLAPFDVADRWFERGMGWPQIEISETEKEMKITAELPGLDENDIEVQLAHGVLAIRGEKKTEIDAQDRRFSERTYGRFERRIPVDDVDAEKIAAMFNNGVLTVTLPKTAAAQNVKRIAINGR